MIKDIFHAVSSSRRQSARDCACDQSKEKEAQPKELESQSDDNNTTTLAS